MVPTNISMDCNPVLFLKCLKSGLRMGKVIARDRRAFGSAFEHVYRVPYLNFSSFSSISRESSF